MLMLMGFALAFSWYSNSPNLAAGTLVEALPELERLYQQLKARWLPDGEIASRSAAQCTAPDLRRTVTRISGDW